MERLHGLRDFLALKVAAGFAYIVLLDGLPQTAVSVPAVALAGLAAFLTLSSQRWREALWLLLGLHLWARIVAPWPYALNHSGLEAYFLLVLAVGPEDESTEKVLGRSYLAVWLYAALQKMVHGFYWTGENLLLEAMARRLSLGPLPFWHGQPYGLSPYLIGTALVVGWLVVALEVILPLWASYGGRTGLGLFVAFQVVACSVTGEYDFLFTNLACTLLFLTTAQSRHFSILAALYGGYLTFRWMGTL